MHERYGPSNGAVHTFPYLHAHVRWERRVWYQIRAVSLFVGVVVALEEHRSCVPAIELYHPPRLYVPRRIEQDRVADCELGAHLVKSDSDLAGGVFVGYEKEWEKGYDCDVAGVGRHVEWAAPLNSNVLWGNHHLDQFASRPGDVLR